MKCVAFGLGALFLCAATAAGQYTFVVTEHKGGWSSTTQGFADGTKFRLEPEEGKTADNPQGIYEVSVDSGRSVYLINPATHEYARVDFQRLMADATEKLEALLKQTALQIESPKVETMLTEPGGTLDGHPTRHYKLRILLFHALSQDRCAPPVPGVSRPLDGSRPRTSGCIESPDPFSSYRRCTHRRGVGARTRKNTRLPSAAGHIANRGQ